ncbi:MAG: cytidylate kinase-like family protein, partial [Deltaproteobacteria bacterium]|nr:cytidylate kinase-like family protein [Deltaproteobacteria bacterium]
MSVITISRQFGAGGKTIGEMVSRKLGYLFFDDQIIQMIAARARVSPGWVKSIEREAGGMLQKFILSVGRKSFAERISEEGGYIDEEIYIDLLNTIITKIASEGNVVILGRGGQYILRDFSDAYHVLIVA